MNRIRSCVCSAGAARGGIGLSRWRPFSIAFVCDAGTLCGSSTGHSGSGASVASRQALAVCKRDFTEFGHFVVFMPFGRGRPNASLWAKKRLDTVSHCLAYAGSCDECSGGAAQDAVCDEILAVVGWHFTS